MWPCISSSHLPAAGNPNNNRAGSRFEPSQWKTLLHCNYVSHWLGASLASTLNKQITWTLWPGAWYGPNRSPPLTHPWCVSGVSGLKLWVHIIGPPSHWSPISLVPHLIGPPSHWSPISLIPQLAPMHHSFHWSPISLVPPTHWSPISLVPHLIGPLLIGPLIHKSPLHYLNSLVPLLIGPPFH